TAASHHTHLKSQRGTGAPAGTFPIMPTQRKNNDKILRKWPRLYCNLHANSPSLPSYTLSPAITHTHTHTHTHRERQTHTKVTFNAERKGWHLLRWLRAETPGRLTVFTPK